MSGWINEVELNENFVLLSGYRRHFWYAYIYLIVFLVISDIICSLVQQLCYYELFGRFLELRISQNQMVQVFFQPLKQKSNNRGETSEIRV